MNIDFNEWKELAKKDPKLFELRRKQVIKKLINELPADNRLLEGLQFRLDMERRRSGDYMSSCLRIYEIMMEHYHNKVLQTFLFDDSAAWTDSACINNEKTSAEIITFKSLQGS